MAGAKGPAAAPMAAKRTTSGAEAVRRLGGKYVHAPKEAIA